MMKLAKIFFPLSIIFFFLHISCNSNYNKEKIIHPLSSITDTNVVLPPAWAFGIIYGAYTSQDQTIELINKIIEHDYPIDGFWIDSWFWDWQNKGLGPDKYMDFIADTISYYDMEEMWDFMKDKNIKSGIWVWDCILKTGNEKVYEEFKSKNLFSNEYIKTDTWHNGGRTTIIGDNSKQVEGTWCGNIDFENPEAVKLFEIKMKHFFEKGVDFIKLDKTDAIPVCKSIFEMTQKFGNETKGRGFILSHSHGVDYEEYKRYPGKWTDDTRSDWNVSNPNREFSPWLPKVAFKENIEKYTNKGNHFHKIPFLANDMGGFAVSLDNHIDEELYVRWLEFSIFNPITTVFSAPENQTQNIAFKVSERADNIFRKYSHLKMELFPYIYSYAHKSRIEGKNTIRPIDGYLFQYLFGDEILIAPIYKQGTESREVYLPKNSSWVNFWNNDILKGDQIIKAEAPIEQIPIFIKQGSIIPKREFARSIEMGNNESLILDIYLGDNGKFTLIEDDGISNDYLEGIYAKTEFELKYFGEKYTLIINPIEGLFNGMKKIRNWEIVINSQKEIEKIFLNNKEINFMKEKSKYIVQSFSSKKSKENIIEILHK